MAIWERKGKDRLQIGESYWKNRNGLKNKTYVLALPELTLSVSEVTVATFWTVSLVLFEVSTKLSFIHINQSV